MVCNSLEIKQRIDLNMKLYFYGVCDTICNVIWSLASLMKMIKNESMLMKWNGGTLKV